MQLTRILTCNHLFAARIYQSQTRNLLQNGQSDIGGDTEVHNQPLLVTVLWNIGNAVLHRLLWRTNACFFAIEPDFSALCSVYAKEYTRHLCAPGTYQARETQDFAPAKLETHIGKNTFPREVAHLQYHTPNLGLAFGEKVGEFTSNHVLDDLFGSHFADRGCNDMCAITKDSQAISYCEHLFQTMADEKNSYISLTKLLHNG